jgi:hypothetical protein
MTQITVQTLLQVRNGNLDSQLNFPAATFVQAAVGGPTPGYMTIGTSEESTTFPELGTLGWLVMKNLSAANFVEWGFSTGVYGGRMEPNETAGPFRLNPGAELFLKADTAACKCLIYAFED